MDRRVSSLISGRFAGYMLSPNKMTDENLANSGAQFDKLYQTATGLTRNHELPRMEIVQLNRNRTLRMYPL